MESKESKLVELKLKMEEVENEYRAAEKDKSVIDEYSEILNKGSCHKGLTETVLMKKLSELDFIKISQNELYEYSKHVTGKEMPIWASTQTNNVKHSSGSTQTENITSLSTSTQTEMDVSAAKKAPSKASLSPEVLSTALVDHYNYCDTDDSQYASEFSPSTPGLVYDDQSESESEDATECECILKQLAGEPSWNFPIAIKAYVNISRQHPLEVRNDNFLNICPFEFHVNADLIRNRLKRNEQMFRIIVTCSHLHGKKKSLPRSNFEFGITLENHTRDTKKTTTGVWDYPKCKKLYWSSMPFLEMLDRQKGWIHKDNDVLIILQLKRYQHLAAF